MSTRDFMLEIGCEEIPARMIAGAVSDLAERVTGILDAASLAHGESSTFSTPRRIAVLVREVAPRQEDREEEVLGPPVKAAYGPDGTPTKAAAGFAQKMGVRPEDLLKIPTPKGEYLGVRRTVAGRGAGEVLAGELPRAVSTMTFPKTMRWGDGARRFVRPVHWVVALLGAQVVPLDLFGVRSGRDSRGHRVLGSGPVVIASTADYQQALLAQGVVADREARRSALARELSGMAAAEHVRPVEDEDLLDEVADLVEHPGAVLGSFPPEFLSLPREVLVTTLRHHQKAFSTEPLADESAGTDDVADRSPQTLGTAGRALLAGSPEGGTFASATSEDARLRQGEGATRALANFFLVVADADRDSEGHIRRGNEWVVIGRLEDARFFFEEDRRTPLAARLEKLAHVTFHAKAGSYADKSRRVEEIAAALASAVNEARAGSVSASGASLGSAPDGSPAPGEAFPSRGAEVDRARGSKQAAIDVEVVRKAARLAKCDLVTGLVGEFPELQGIAGGLYLKAEAAAAVISDPGSSTSAASVPGTRTPETPVNGASDGRKAVADAIYDQYRPAGASDALPRTQEGAILALADRLDTVGTLARTVGLPTGSRDPFGLRRAAGGTIRLVAETPLPLSLGQIWSTTVSALDRAGLAAQSGVADEDWLAFLRERLQHWLKANGAEYDSANAVMLAAHGERADRETIPRVAEKVFALERLREMPDLAALVEVHKRCRNILEQAAGAGATAKLATAVKEDPEEAGAFATLLEEAMGAEQSVGRAVQNDEFEPGLQSLVRLRPALSRFFDHVLVMHPDAELRRQRLDLVRRIAVMIEEVADLKQLAISRDERRALRET